MSGDLPMSGAAVEGIDFDRWAVILRKSDTVARGLVEQIRALQHGV